MELTFMAYNLNNYGATYSIVLIDQFCHYTSLSCLNEQLGYDFVNDYVINAIANGGEFTQNKDSIVFHNVEGAVNTLKNLERYSIMLSLAKRGG